MFRIAAARIRQGYRTFKYPYGPPPPLPERFRGAPVIDPSMCADGCSRCEAACPVSAISAPAGSVRLDMGRCLFCGECARQCPSDALRFGKDYRLAAWRREALVVGEKDSVISEPPDAIMKQEAATGTGLFGPPAPLDHIRQAPAFIKKMFGRSLKLRQVSAGGCNACEADANVLTTPAWDISRFGIQFVASPRHADGILVTGPVSENMKLALEKTYAAVPTPRVVIAMGACAISGGPYRDHPEVCNGADSVVPVDIYVPGCPPHPLTLLEALLILQGRLER